MSGYSECVVSWVTTDCSESGYRDHDRKALDTTSREHGASIRRRFNGLSNAVDRGDVSPGPAYHADLVGILSLSASSDDRTSGALTLITNLSLALSDLPRSVKRNYS